MVHLTTATIILIIYYTILCIVTYLGKKVLRSSIGTPSLLTYGFTVLDRSKHSLCLTCPENKKYILAWGI